MLPKMIYRFSAISTRILVVFFTEVENNPKIICHMEAPKKKNPRIAKITLSRQSSARDMPITNLELYHRGTVTKQHSTGIKDM